MKKKDIVTWSSSHYLALPSLFFLLVLNFSSAIELAHWCDDLEGHKALSEPLGAHSTRHSTKYNQHSLQEAKDRLASNHTCHDCLVSHINPLKLPSERSVSLELPVMRQFYSITEMIPYYIFHRDSYAKRAPPSL